MPIRRSALVALCLSSLTGNSSQQERECDLKLLRWQGFQVITEQLGGELRRVIGDVQQVQYTAE
jgi:hypothetical protein